MTEQPHDDALPIVHNEITGPFSGTAIQTGSVGSINHVEGDQHLHYLDGARDRLRTSPGTVASDCPYPGLAAFEPEQAAWFFGRDALLAELIAGLDRRLRSGGAQVVVAPSGAGKSSLLSAGLLPKLGQGALPGSDQWPTLVLTPTAHPLREFAGRIASLIGDDVASNPSQLSAGLAALVSEDPKSRVVVVVDQFEELFTQCTDDEQRRTFIDLLVEISTPSDARRSALVVIGLRADFYAACIDHPPLRAALQDSPLVVGPMTETELREAILFPARSVGLDVEPGLVELLLRDLGATAADDGSAAYEAGRLPLLAHALRVSWQQRNGATLTLQGYQDTGGIQHAIAVTADRALAGLGQVAPQAPELARQVLLRLVRVGEDSETTRRRVDRAQLAAEFEDSETLDMVLAALTAPDTRLLTADEDTIQLAHEALIGAWPTLRGWLSDNRAGVLAAQQLADAAERWAADDEDPGQLYQGLRLEVAQSLLEDTEAGPPIGVLGRRFLVASQAGRDADRRLARRRRRRARITLAVIVVLLLIAGVAVTANETTRDQRDAQELLATARAELAAADSRRADHPVDALRWGITASWFAANTDDPTTMESAHGGLVRTIADSWYFRGLRTVPDLLGIDTGEGDWLLTLTKHGELGLWDTAGEPGTARNVPLGPTGGPISQATVLPRRNLLVTVAVDGPLTVWNLADRHVPQRLGTAAAGPTAITTLRSTSDGNRILSGDENGAVAVWDLAEPSHPVRQGTGVPPCSPHCNPVLDVAIRADGGSMVSVDRNAVTTWTIPGTGNPRRGRQVQLPPLPNPIQNARSAEHRSITATPDSSIATSLRPDGGAVAVGGTDGRAASAMLAGDPAQPDPAATGRLRTLAALPGHELHTDLVLFSHDGRQVATAGTDRSVRLWDVTDPAHPVLRHQFAAQPGPIASLAFSTSDQLLLVAGRDGTVAEYLTDGLVTPRDPVNVPAERPLVWADPDPKGGEATASRSGRRLLAIGDPVGRLMVVGRAAAESALMSDSFVPSDEFDGSVSLWRLGDGKPAALGKIDHRHTPTALALGPANRVLAVGDGLGGLGLWDLTDPATPRLLIDMNHDALGIGLSEITSAAITHDGRRLALGTAEFGVLLLDISTPDHPAITTRLTEPTGSVHGLAFSPDDGTLTVGSGDGFVRFWDMRGGQVLAAAVPSASGQVVSAVYAPGKPLLATGSVTGSVTLWDVTSPRQPIALQTIPGPPKGAMVVQFTPDGAGLAATDGYEQVNRWSVVNAGQAVADPARVACGLVGRGLSQAEWEADRDLSHYDYQAMC
ncbi:NACHT and WD repeat domain-containing protein [Amycolatopsis solani]|uniref:NACHT and WD repeat domain-containing protein n=1 Tax=Amycolatopsis solani TaxID=3028615 RepID=UPI0025B21017|nr:AAA family ATPase [Amycolatopsis sp. MEP2-6]